jgi:hypothetical protein
MSIKQTLSQIGRARGYASANMTKGNDSFTHGALLVVNGLGVVLLLSRSGWTLDVITCIFRDGMHVRRWHINMAHEDNLSMTKEIQVWRMPPSLRGSVGDLQLQGSDSPQESTRRPIYTITRSSGKKLKIQEEKLAPQKINKVIEDLEIRSRPQTGTQISINTGLAHFILTGRQLLLQCAQGRCNCSFGNFAIFGLLVILESAPHLEKLLLGYSWSYY